MKTTDIFTSAALIPASSGTENCLAIGTRLSDFEITGILGEGGFGIVYVAFDHSLQRTVAIKEYMPGALSGRAADKSVMVRAERHQQTFNVGLKSFINESRFLAQFDHPSLVKVYRYWEQNKTAYMAMRYYDGRTIKDIVANSPEIVTEQWCKFIFKQILDALETLYTMKILHRDVSPDNIIVQKNGDAVLLDFGSARQIIGDMTKGMTVILKPGYAPVEQYADDASMAQGTWTDIYSLSAVMYFAIAKEAPTTSIARMVKDTHISLQTRAPAKYTDRFLAAIDKGLAVQALNRPQTIDEFRKLLGIGAFDEARARHAGAPERNPARSTSLKRPHDAEKALALPAVIEKQKQLQAALAARAAAAKQMIEAPPQQDPAQAAVARPRAMMNTLLAQRPLLAGLIVGALLLATLGHYALESTPRNTAVELEPESKAPTLPTTEALAARLEAETKAWEVLQNEPDVGKQQIAAFLQQFPSGKYAELAKQRMSELPARAPEAAPPAPESNPAYALAASLPAPDATAAPRGALPAPQAARNPVSATASYKLRVKPWGTIYVDGKVRGVSPPLKTLVLPAGKHKVRITNPGFPDYFTEIGATKKKFGNIEHNFSAVHK